jgi:hypothetical protein
VIRFVHYGKSMSDIVENGELLSLLDHLNDEEGRTRTGGA